MASLHTIQFPILETFPGLVHGFSTRKGGYSEDPYTSLNLGLTTGDDPEVVRKNRKKFYENLAIDASRIVYPVQIHSANIRIVEKPGRLNNCDALITNRTGLYLSIQTADCFPVFLYEPAEQAIALIHSGWKGAAADITGNTIKKMVDHYHLHPENLYAGIGPGVQKRNFQVDAPVYNRFDPRYFTDDGPGHYKMDLQQVIFDQLVNRGVKPNRIEKIMDCTFDKSDLYYSYRRDGTKSGRMMGIIGLKS